MTYRAAIPMLLICCATLIGGEQQAEGHAIEVVKTWSDLAKQPAIELHKNATARFGIQAIRAPLYSGVMLYCMTDAYDPENDADQDEFERLGPFRLTVRSPGQDDQKTGIEKAKVLRDPGKRDYGRLVFGQLIPLGRLGTHAVELRDANDAVVASVKIECVSAPFHAWTALVGSDDDAAQNEEADGVCNAAIQTAAGSAALPKLNGGVPITYWLASGVRGPRKFSEDDALPTLADDAAKELPPLTAAQSALAAKWIAALGSDRYETRNSAMEALLALGSPVGELVQKAVRQTADAEALLRLRTILMKLDGPFRIRMDGMNVLVRTPVFFPAVDVESYFLARWWVNGVAVKPNNDLEPPAMTDQGAVPANTEARFALKFNATALGAKTGDKVALQLLFCPDGMRDLMDETAESPKEKSMESDPKSEEAPGHFPVVSNKIEFTAP